MPFKCNSDRVQNEGFGLYAAHTEKLSYIQLSTK